MNKKEEICSLRNFNAKLEIISYNDYLVKFLVKPF